MGSVPKKAVSKPPADRQPMCDNDILRLLARSDRPFHSLHRTHFWVTATAIRDRLVRLTTLQMVTRRTTASSSGAARGICTHIKRAGRGGVAPPDDEGMD